MNDTKVAEKYTSERFQELWRQLNHNQRRFVVAMLDAENKKEAAEAINIQPTTVYHWPPIVDEAITLLSQDVKDSVVSILASGAAKAAMIKLAGLDSGSEEMRQKVASEVLDRTLGKAMSSIDVTTGGEKLHGNLTDEKRIEHIFELFERVRQRQAEADKVMEKG